MKFIVYRSSQSPELFDVPDERRSWMKPCEEVVKGRTVWKWNDCNEAVDAWFVEFDTLEAFVEWTLKRGCDVIVGTGKYPMPEYPHIEIYDDYRE
jgi:hypothetical protein